MSVDGTDFKIAGLGPLFSSLAKRSGLRHEIALCVLTGDIVWMNGPFPARVHDMTIFRNSPLSHLDDNERVEADDGYIGEAPCHVKCPKCFTNPRETEAMQARVRMRQETVNTRFKNWGVCRQRFRHAIEDHGQYFRAVVVMTQVAINHGEKLFLTGYRDPPYTNTAFDVADDDAEE